MNNGPILSPLNSDDNTKNRFNNGSNKGYGRVNRPLMSTPSYLSRPTIYSDCFISMYILLTHIFSALECRFVQACSFYKPIFEKQVRGESGNSLVSNLLTSATT